MMTILRYAITLTTLALLLPPPVSAQVLEFAQQTPFPQIGGPQNPRLALDGDANVFLAGRLPQDIAVDFDMSDGVAEVLFDNEYDSSGRAAFVAKYDADGAYQWAFGLSLDGTAFNLDIKDVAADAAGNVTIAGLFATREVDDAPLPVDFDPGPGVTTLNGTGDTTENVGFVASYDADGNLRWAFELIAITTFQDLSSVTVGGALEGLTVDTDGNVYVTGEIFGRVVPEIGITTTVELDPLGGGFETTEMGGLVAKYTPDGTLAWAQPLVTAAGDEGAMAFAEGERLAVDAEGRVYASGRFSFGPIDFGGIVLGSGEDFDPDLYLVQYDADGAAQWAFPLGNEGARFINSEMKVSPDGGVLWTGYFRGTVDFDPSDGDATRTALTYPTGTSFDDVFAAYYDESGALEWVRQVSGVFNQEVVNYYLDTTAEGRAFLIGEASPAEQIEPPDGPLVGNGDAVESLLVEYTLAEGTLEALYVTEDPPPNGDRSDVQIYGMDIVPSGKLYLLGLVTTLNGEIPYDFDYGGGESTLPVEGTGLFLARYDATMTPVAGEDGPATAAAFTLSRPYPNPARQARVTLGIDAAQTVRIALFDVLGRRVRALHDGPLVPGEHAVEIDGAGLPSGVYFVRATGEGISRTVPVTLLR